MKEKYLILSNFDVFREEHNKLIKRAAGRGDAIIGIPTDEFAYELQGYYPVHDYQKRYAYVSKHSFNSDTWQVKDKRDIDDLLKKCTTMFLSSYENYRMQDFLKRIYFNKKIEVHPEKKKRLSTGNNMSKKQ